MWNRENRFQDPGSPYSPVQNPQFETRFVLKKRKGGHSHSGFASLLPLPVSPGGTLTGDDSNRHVHVVHLARKGGRHHPCAHKQAARHHHQVVAKAIAQDRGERSCVGRAQGKVPQPGAPRPGAHAAAYTARRGCAAPAGNRASSLEQHGLDLRRGHHYSNF